MFNCSNVLNYLAIPVYVLWGWFLNFMKIIFNDCILHDINVLVSVSHPALGKFTPALTLYQSVSLSLFVQLSWGTTVKQSIVQAICLTTASSPTLPKTSTKRSPNITSSTGKHSCGCDPVHIQMHVLTQRDWHIQHTQDYGMSHWVTLSNIIMTPFVGVM